MARIVILVLILSFSSAGFSGDEAPSKIYFVTGDEGRFLWKNYPFFGRTLGELARFFVLQIHSDITGEGPDDFYKTDILSAVGEQWSTRFSIQKQIEELRHKGYQIEFIPQIDVLKLLSILSDPDTMAIFHGGHSYVANETNFYDLAYKGKGEVFLSVYEDGKPSALTIEVLERAKNKLGRQSYKASPDLKLFFTGACYAGYCNPRIRQKLGLSDFTQVLTTKDSKMGRPAMASTHRDMVESFNTTIRNWVANLPNLECNSILKGFGGKQLAR